MAAATTDHAEQNYPHASGNEDLRQRHRFFAFSPRSTLRFSR
jgi:hypothetical protein